MQLSNAPAQLVEAWATGDSTKTNPIPVPSQIGITPGAASWTDGFPPLCATPIASGGIPPAKSDMNGGLYQMSAVDVWTCAGAGFPYSSAFSTAIGGYPKGSRVFMASGTGYWRSTVDNNVPDPDTGGAGWVSDAALPLIISVAYSATPNFNCAAGNPLIPVFQITLTGNVTGPTLTNAVPGQTVRFIIVQDSTGSRTFAWPSQVQNGGAIDPTASTTSVQSFVVDASGNLQATSGIIG